MSFVKNAWYCAGWSNELVDAPRGLRILGEEVVVYRRGDGALSALSGICPHRFAPMSRGRVMGDNLQCGYHGLEFDASGACVRNPHGRGIIPPAAKLKRYQAVERDGVIWVWMGDPSEADETAITPLDTLNDARRWAGVTGYLRIDANYQLVIDNLLDLSHSAYLHPGTVGLDAREVPVSKRQHTVRSSGTVILSNTRIPQVPPPKSFSSWCGATRGDLASEMTLNLPSNMVLDVCFKGEGLVGDAAHLVGAHFLTPETEDTTHYFYSLHRNRRLEDQALTESLGALVRKAFMEEDEPMLEACAEMMAGREFFSLSPAILETDSAAIMARRALRRLHQDADLDA